MPLHRIIRGQVRVAGTDIGLWDELAGVVIPVQEEKNYYCQCTDRFWTPPLLLFSGYRRSFSVLKWTRCVVIYSPPSAEVQSEWSCTSTSLICLHVVDKEKK